jgi:hypothetical protein
MNVLWLERFGLDGGTYSQLMFNAGLKTTSNFVVHRFSA